MPTRYGLPGRDSSHRRATELTEPVKRAMSRREERRRIWKGVEGHAVADLLGNLLFPEEAYDVNAGRLRILRAGAAARRRAYRLDYSGTCRRWRKSDRERFEWSFTQSDVSLAPRRTNSGRYVVKTILSPVMKQSIWTTSEYERALSETNRKRASEGQKPAEDADGAEIRRVRGENPSGPCF